jgi:hypothetical protein
MIINQLKQMIMKKQILFTTLLFSLAIQAIAAKHTVSNNQTNTAQFTNIQDAVNAANDGDTILVHGTPNIYPSFDLVDKKMTFIGPGWAPDKNIALPAIIAGCTFRNSANPGSPSGSELQGLIFSNGVNLANFAAGGDLGVSNLNIIRCQFNSTVSHSLSVSNNLYESCIFLTTIAFTNNSNTFTTNILFQNNIIFANQCCTGVGITGLSNPTNVHFNHNLFYSDGNVAAFSGCNFLTLSNNIFSKRNPESGLSNSTFTNNITFNCGALGDTAWIRNGNVDGGGNIAGTNPQMADQVAVTAGSLSGLLNFTIASGAANNAGSDGKDLGLLFDATGAVNWTNARNSRFPRITQMNVVNPSIAPGGNLNVNVQAKVSN